MFISANRYYGKHKEHRSITRGSNMSWENWKNIPEVPYSKCYITSDNYCHTCNRILNQLNQTWNNCSILMEVQKSVFQIYFIISICSFMT